MDDKPSEKKCERCGEPLKFLGHDYCAVCAKILCGKCMTEGHCGNVPALSGLQADYGADDLGA